MELNEYQQQAMSTCMDTCNNLTYMLTGLTAEVGEVNDKIAKAVRKEQVKITRNNLCVWDDRTPANFKEELAKADFCDDTCYSMPDWCVMIEGDDRIYFKKIEEEL